MDAILVKERSKHPPPNNLLPLYEPSTSDRGNVTNRARGGRRTRRERVVLALVAAGFLTCGSCRYAHGIVQVRKPAPTVGWSLPSCARHSPRSRRFRYLRFPPPCERLSAGKETCTCGWGGSQRHAGGIVLVAAGFLTCGSHRHAHGIVQVRKPAPTVGRFHRHAHGVVLVAAGFLTCSSHRHAHGIVQLRKPAPTVGREAVLTRRSARRPYSHLPYDARYPASSPRHLPACRRR